MGIIIHSLESVSFKDLYAAFSSACSTDEDTIHNYLSEHFSKDG